MFDEFLADIFHGSAIYHAVSNPVIHVACESIIYIYFIV